VPVPQPCQVVLLGAGHGRHELAAQPGGASVAGLEGGHAVVGSSGQAHLGRGHGDGLAPADMGLGGVQHVDGEVGGEPGELCAGVGQRPGATEGLTGV
jgi:hypothetical protein